MTPEPVITSSARKHGIDDEDSLHAYRNAVDAFTLEEGLIMLVGPARTGTPLEIGVAQSEEGTPVIVHAMEARPRFLR